MAFYIATLPHGIHGRAKEQFANYNALVLAYKSSAPVRAAKTSSIDLELCWVTAISNYDS